MPRCRVDARVQPKELDEAAVAALQALAPFGMGNPVVQLGFRGLVHARPPQRLKDQHWKLWVTDGGRAVETVWWGAGSRPLPEGSFDLAAVPEIGEYGGRRFVQLRLVDWRPAEAATT